MKRIIVIMVLVKFLVLMATQLNYSQGTVKTSDYSLWALGWAVSSSGISGGTQVSLASCYGGSGAVAMSEYITGTPSYSTDFNFAAGGGYAGTEMTFPYAGSKINSIIISSKNFSQSVHSCVSLSQSGNPYQYMGYYVGLGNCGAVAPMSMQMLFYDAYNISGTWYSVVVPCNYN